jgi:multidrug transporter EmrE-like cation transporter
MNRLALLGLILTSVLLNASAQILLRWGARQSGGFAGPPDTGALVALFLRPGVLGGLVCYGLSLLAWLQVLSKSDASFAYPFLGLGFAFVAFAGWYFLGEPITLRRLGGTAIIMAGVLLLASEKA